MWLWDGLMIQEGGGGEGWGGGTDKQSSSQNLLRLLHVHKMCVHVYVHAHYLYWVITMSCLWLLVLPRHNILFYGFWLIIKYCAPWQYKSLHVSSYPYTYIAHQKSACTHTYCITCAHHTWAEIPSLQLLILPLHALVWLLFGLWLKLQFCGKWQDNH